MTNLGLSRWIELSFVSDSDVDIAVCIMIGSSVTIKEDEHIVLESSLDGRTLASIRFDSSCCIIGDGIRSFIVWESIVDTVGKVLYFDTCCLCHSCNSRVINLLEKKIKI